MKEFLPSFVFNRSRGLNKQKVEDINFKIKDFIIDSKHINSVKGREIVLELGSGYGDTIIHLAKLYPQKLFIACEVYPKALMSIYQRAKDENLTNVKLFNQDARLLLKDLNDTSLSLILVLFPDPWPKARHFKRRIIKHETLALFKQKLKSNGEVFIATDHESYKEWIATTILNQDLFAWQAECEADFTQKPEWWTQTKFQSKAINEGRSTAYIKLKSI